MKIIDDDITPHNNSLSAAQQKERDGVSERKIKREGEREEKFA